MINVRNATHTDIVPIVQLGKCLRQQSAYANKQFCDQKASEMVAKMIDSDTDNAFVAEEQGKVIGFFLGGITYEWFSNDLIAFDYSVYVMPTKRNGRTAIKLFNAFEQWAQAKGANRIQVGITTNINVTATSRFYHYLGYQDGGVLFEKRM